MVAFSLSTVASVNPSVRGYGQQLIIKFTHALAWCYSFQIGKKIAVTLTLSTGWYTVCLHLFSWRPSPRIHVRMVQLSRVSLFFHFTFIANLLYWLGYNTDACMRSTAIDSNNTMRKSKAQLSTTLQKHVQTVRAYYSRE